MGRALLLSLACFAASSAVAAGDGNRLTYLDENNPYYPHRDFPKLVTPQWVGEDGVEAVVILAIDDMRDPPRYEGYFRPILQRLKEIDGRAPVSIMTCSVNPDAPRLRSWLDEGLSIEVHTVDHPCPLLQGGDFEKAKSTYDRCVDLLDEIPGNKPVAFRMPCCDSLNTVSPRFFAEIFNRTTERGNFLRISSSVFNIFTSNDPEIPRELVIDPDGRDRFRKYIPRNLQRGGAVFDTFVNTIEDYPYPYVINGLCWEFPCTVPSDWEAQHLHQPNNPQTVEDWKAALDITVLKQGVFTMVFHPHGWIESEQVVELIDHAVAKHGKKVKFLTFREALERLNSNLLDDRPLRDADGGDNFVRIVDVDNDGYLDVVDLQSNPHDRPPAVSTKLWEPARRSWRRLEPVPTIPGGVDPRERPLVRFGLATGGTTAFIMGVETTYSDGGEGRRSLAYQFDGANWTLFPGRYASTGEAHEDSEGDPPSSPIKEEFAPLATYSTKTAGHDTGVRLRDLDGDGESELLAPRGCYRWLTSNKRWRRLPFDLPKKSRITGVNGRDAGLRFVDVNEDGFDDVVFSNAQRYGVWLFESMESGWSIELFAGKRGEKPPDEELPPIVRADGSDNGFFVHSRHLFWQNEDTAHLPDLVDRRSFADLLGERQPGPKSPEASLDCFKPRDGFTVELVAAEPLVRDPVAFDWGADGRLWVAEMADYPLGMDAQGTPGGRVRFLEDTDGDGRYDRSTVFLDGVPFPTGVMAWREGVLVSAAPDIFYAADTDGDGRADQRTTLYTGFGEGNQQHRVNGFAWGLDNWVYCANGDSNGRIRAEWALTDDGPLKTDSEPIDISGRDLRIDPATGRLDTVTGRTQFGRSRDDWGNWFGCNNSNPLYHFVLEDRYLRRNPHYAASTTRAQVSVNPGPAPCYPISRTLARFNDFDRANRFTSACSAILYRDELFGPQFAGNSFVSEPVHNVIHREIVEPAGSTFTSRRAPDERESEFLASSDNWFRPTQIRTGPDGALWIADMYRHVIEHPRWIPAEWQKRLDLRAGDDRGRIYRVYPVRKRPRPIPRLEELSPTDLVAQLDSPSGWVRDRVQQLLVDRTVARETVAPTLARRVRSGDNPLCRLHALCTLNGLEALTPELLRDALSDPHPGVQRHAVRLCESLEPLPEELCAALYDLADASDPQLRIQLAYTLGEIDDSRAGRAIGELITTRPTPDAAVFDRYLFAAAMSSLSSRNLREAVAGIENERVEPPVRNHHRQYLLMLATALNHPPSLAALIDNVVDPVAGRYRTWQFSAVHQLLTTLERRNESLEKIRRTRHEPLNVAAQRLDAVLTAARARAADPGAPLSERVAAARLLGRTETDLKGDLELLAGLLHPQSPAELQQTAVNALADQSAPQAAAILLAEWRSYGPALRGEVLDALLSRSAWRDALLAAVENGRIAPVDVDVVRRQRLLEQGSSEIRQRAAAVFGEAVDSDRRALVARYAEQLDKPADPQHGAALFAKTCAQCHKLARKGHAVGPELTALSDKSPRALLTAVLDPNRAVESKYHNYTAATVSGRTFSGILTDETGNSITLTGPEARRKTILRSDLELLQSTSKSMMPEGLEKDLQPADLADLIAYVRGNIPLPERKRFPGNKPALVTAGDDGSLLLPPSQCKIYGTTLVLEQKYGNLGYWSSGDDHAVWNVEVPAAGVYRVDVEWACHPSTAGNVLEIVAGDESLKATVASTGSWDNYRTAEIGLVKLSAGRQQIVVRPASRLQGSLVDLKSLKLSP